jgi:hypothetical protein
MSTTGPIFPRSASTLSESGWTGNTWLTPENLYGAGNAAITAATFDQGVKSYVLRAYGFDFSGIPDGSTIAGVQVGIGGAYYATGLCSLAMARLLTAQGSQAGTNQYATPTVVTTTAANYTKGGAADLWGNVLDSAWVKSSLFGVGIGVSVQSNNCDVFINSLSMEVWYTVTAQSDTVADNLGISDSAYRSMTIVRRPGG